MFYGIQRSGSVGTRAAEVAGGRVFPLCPAAGAAYESTQDGLERLPY
jgi:hypothetical protein